MLLVATFDLTLPQLHTIMVHRPKDRGLTTHPILHDLATKIDPINEMQVALRSLRTYLRLLLLVFSLEAFSKVRRGSRFASDQIESSSGRTY